MIDCYLSLLYNRVLALEFGNEILIWMLVHHLEGRILCNHIRQLECSSLLVWNFCMPCSNEYPLFIPRQNYCSTSGENSWSDRSSSNFGVASMESERKPQLDICRSGSFNYSSASSHSVETHKDLQRGISLLKKSVACITTYCYNSLCLDVPSEASTFEAFARLLSILSSSKEVRSVTSLKMACSRYTLSLPLSTMKKVETVFSVWFWVRLSPF